jgi:hypothetical protein
MAEGNYLGNRCELATKVLILALRGARRGAVANADTKPRINLASHLFEESMDPCCRFLCGFTRIENQGTSKPRVAGKFQATDQAQLTQ